MEESLLSIDPLNLEEPKEPSSLNLLMTKSKSIKKIG